MYNECMRNITPMTGIGAVFVRGFMEAYYDGKTKLFDCQLAGKESVKEAGGEISDTYLSTLSRRLSGDGLVKKYKVGRSWHLKDGDFTNEFQSFLVEHEDWGLLVDGTVDDIKGKVRVFDELDEHGAVRGGGDQLIPRAAFRQLAAGVKEGKYDIVYVRAGLTVGVKHNGATHRIERYVED